MKNGNIPLDGEKGFSFDIDIKGMMNAMLLKEIEKSDGNTARVLRVLVKRGFSVQEALEILMEMAVVIKGDDEQEE